MPRARKIDPTIKYFPPRLLSKLDYIKKYPMTIIEAPSGFGKTTLLEYFFEEKISKAVPYCSYDFESDEPLFIWRQICQQIGKIDSDCGDQLRLCGQPDEDNIQEIYQILKGLNCPHEAYLWLDNYKRWNNAFSREFLQILGKHGGKELHIVVTTQPLPSEKNFRTAEGSFLWQMDDEDLTFHREDISAYFTSAGISLSDSQINHVFSLTEGWIMALSLQMLCYINRGEFERGGMMALMEHTFWDRLTKEEQDFLLKISVFPKFSLAQATALSGLGGSKTVKLLRDKRYFIHFDAESRNFYPHSQLRNLLTEHFSCLPPEEQKEIYLRAAELSMQEKNRFNTLRFYYAAGEWERILEQPLTSYEIADIMNSEARPMVLDIMNRAPMEVKLRHPQAVMSMAFALFIMGENQKLMELQGEIRSIIENSSISPREKNSLNGEMELLLSFLEYNRISDMSRRHKKALELIGGPAKLISPKSVWTFGSPSILYLFWRESGKLDEELDEMDTCMPVYYKLTNNHGCGAELIMRAEAHLTRGEIEKALPLCYQALFVANSHHQDSIYQCGLAILCQIAFLQKDSETLTDTMKNLKELSKNHREDLSRYTYDLVEGFLAVEQNRPDDVAPWLANGDITEKRLVIMAQPEAYIVYGRYLLEKKEYLKLLGVSRYFMGLSRIFPNLLPQVYIHIYCAQANDLLGKSEEAVSSLQQALDIAMPDRVYGPFAENYSGLRHLFPLVQIKHSQRKQIEKISQAFPAVKSDSTESFSPRETEIFNLICDGLTNKEIAERMALSPNTIRNVVSIMFRKKGVKTRVQLRELKSSKK